MPFIPHTEDDVATMLARIGVDSIEALFDEIPAALRSRGLAGIPPAQSEMELLRLAAARARSDGVPRCFIGAGAYERHIPAAVWQIATRGEFYSAYTPYQAEASQGTLQLMYEYQSMMAQLTALEVSNASLYDGASALAEATLMAVRSRPKLPHRVLVPRALHPHYRETLHTIVGSQGIELFDVDFDPATGRTMLDPIREAARDSFCALSIPHPNFFGVIEDVHALTDLAHDRGALVIGAVDPVACALLAPPGEWGSAGADIAVGEGQSLGLPLSGGGPYFGFMCTRRELVRQMPGRIVGRTLDAAGQPGFTLTLQAREQHIRRAKATSNICTNQGLAVTAAVVHMALLGPEGLAAVARASHANTRALVEAVCALHGVRRRFSAPFFQEAVLSLDRPCGAVLRHLESEGILGGLDLGERFTELGEGILVCATETKTAADIDDYTRCLAAALTAP